MVATINQLGSSLDSFNAVSRCRGVGRCHASDPHPRIIGAFTRWPTPLSTITDYRIEAKEGTDALRGANGAGCHGGGLLPQLLKAAARRIEIGTPGVVYLHPESTTSSPQESRAAMPLGQHEQQSLRQQLRRSRRRSSRPKCIMARASMLLALTTPFLLLLLLVAWPARALVVEYPCCANNLHV